MAKPRTLHDKIWDDHLVDQQPDGTCLIYIDRHLVHEVTSPQAFEGLRLTGRKVHAPEKTLCVVDHNVPTTNRNLPNPDPESAAQIAYLAENAKVFGLEYYNEFDRRQGIVHIIGPEQGFTLPGTTLVCGDSHTATHGAFGALAYGIGTSEVEHVLATQTLIQTKSKNMRAVVDGKLPEGVTAKDIILAIIGEIGTAGGTGYALEYAGEACGFQARVWRPLQARRGAHSWASSQNELLVRKKLCRGVALPWCLVPRPAEGQVARAQALVLYAVRDTRRHCGVLFPRRRSDPFRRRNVAVHLPFLVRRGRCERDLPK